MNSTELEKIWRQYKSNHFLEAEQRKKIVTKLMNSHQNKFICNGITFVKVDFPEKVQKAFDLHKQVTLDSVGNWQQITVDILLFRIAQPEELRQLKISHQVFIELDALIAAFSQQHHPDLFEYSIGVKDSTSWQDCCFTKIKIGNPLNMNVFNFSLKHIVK